MGASASVHQWKCCNCGVQYYSDKSPKCPECGQSPEKQPKISRPPKRIFASNVEPESRFLALMKRNNSFIVSIMLVILAVNLHFTVTCFLLCLMYFVICKSSPSAEDMEFTENHFLEETNSEGWACLRCTLMNPATFAKCQACEYDKNAAAQGIEAPKVSLPRHDSWCCNACKKVNSTTEPICTACGVPRGQYLYSSSGRPIQQPSSDRDHSQMNGTSTDPIVIGDSSEDLLWTCVCSYQNNPTIAICDLCNTPRKRHCIKKNKDASTGSKQKLVNKTAKSTWTCSRCSAENENTMKRCQSCDSYSSRAAKHHATEWTCQRCTLENAATAHICAACETKREVILPTEEDINVLTPLVNMMTKNFELIRNKVVGGKKNVSPLNTPEVATSVNAKVVDKSQSKAEENRTRIAPKAEVKVVDKSQSKAEENRTRTRTRTNTWTCVMCTFHNQLSNDLCEICSSEKTEDG